MNVMKLGQLVPKLKEFKKRHPKFMQFFMSAVPENAKEGSILEIKIVCTDGRELRTNIKITSEDEEFLKEAMNALK